MAASEDTLKSVSAMVAEYCEVKDNKQFDHTFTARNTCPVPSDANVGAPALNVESRNRNVWRRAYNLCNNIPDHNLLLWGTYYRSGPP